MKIEMAVEKPEDVRITLNTTMTVAQWGILCGALSSALQGNGMPRWHNDVADFRGAIEAALERVKEKVSGESIPLVS